MFSVSFRFSVCVCVCTIKTPTPFIQDSYHRSDCSLLRPEPTGPSAADGLRVVNLHRIRGSQVECRQDTAAATGGGAGGSSVTLIRVNRQHMCFR